ncbi:MAG: hypothetical protein RLZZ115_2993, partial [Cyanobacteriota bacterium]
MSEEVYHIFIPDQIASHGGNQKVILRSGKSYDVTIPDQLQEGSKLRLKKSDIQDGYVTYIRSKTKGRFMVKILAPVQEILDYYILQERNTSYVFPILLKDDLTPIQIENRKQKTLKKFNKDLKELARLAKVAKNVTSYVIRHSYASNLKQLGVSTDKIS